MRAATAATISSSPTPRTPTWGRGCTPSARCAGATASRDCAPAPNSCGSCADIVKQDIVDILLASASNIEALVEDRVFEGTGVKPAIRANDATDVWRHRGAKHHETPSRPFRTASLSRVTPRLADAADERPRRLDRPRPLFASPSTTSPTPTSPRSKPSPSSAPTAPPTTSNISSRCSTRTRRTASRPRTCRRFVNDSIVRCLAGLTKAERPQFLKIAYNGPRALEELAEFDPSLVVGVLGGGAGTTRDCFELIHQAEKYGARVALFGRKINLAESPLDMVRFMRAVADGDISPKEAVAAYHDTLAKASLEAGARARRGLRDHRKPP